MEVKSHMSKYLVLCVVSMLLALTMAGVKAGRKERCKYTLIIPSDYNNIPEEKSEGNGNIHTRSLSSWTWKATRMENRIPETIWEAECNSMYCVFPTNGTSSSQVVGRQNSVPIYQQILVFHTSASRKCYKASFLNIVVGCTCTKTRTY
ncbi:hypothetical protein DPEC_G00294070 [Dallia pectoralis]|uniref:Uncharacterized protein n=1 Tax=Dallia pectoralis TaxID=75939 RepID=A0ACC2FID7_DALPE|nr:hypothetical protein DPEC_G00294070 [Dallia pectoralis]